MVFEEQVEGGLDGFGVEGFGVHEDQGTGPVEGLADGGRLFQVEGPELGDEFGDLSGQGLGYLGYMDPDDLRLLLRAREIEVEVETPPLEGIAQGALLVAGQDDQGDGLRRDSAQFRDADLEIAQDLQQERLELRVRLVHLIDEQDRLLLRLDGLPGGGAAAGGNRRKKRDRP